MKANPPKANPRNRFTPRIGNNHTPFDAKRRQARRALATVSKRRNRNG